MDFHYTPWWSERPDPVAVSLDGYNDDDVIAYTIRTQHTFWELELLEYVAMVGPRGGIYIDAGGNIGNHAVFFALFCADHVVCIEPHPRLHPIARANLERNGLTSRAIVVPIGLSHESATGWLLRSADSEQNIGRSRVSVLSRADTPTDGFAVPLRTLDDVLRDARPTLPAQPVTFLKIDVEGMDVDVLRGASECLQRDHPQILIELITPAAHAAATELLDRFGYREIATLGDPPSYYFADPRRHVLRPNLWHGGDHYAHQMHEAAGDLRLATPGDAALIIADGDELDWTGYLGARTRMPFPEDEKEFAGHPNDDRHAVRELTRLRAGGATHFVIAWPVFWYLDVYREFASRLRQQHRCVLENDRMLVFELRGQDAP